MSVKFEKDVIQQTGGVAGTQALVKGGKHELAEEIGTALTGGKGNAGTPGYLAVSCDIVRQWNTADCITQTYLRELQENPLRTKMLTSGTLSGLQEFLASWIAKDRNKDGSYLTARVPKMAAYGAFISAPMGHILISILQRAFAGRTSLKAKVLQILASNLIVSFAR